MDSCTEFPTSHETSTERTGNLDGFTQTPSLSSESSDLDPEVLGQRLRSLAGEVAWSWEIRIILYTARSAGGSISERNEYKVDDVQSQADNEENDIIVEHTLEPVSFPGKSQTPHSPASVPEVVDVTAQQRSMPSAVVLEEEQTFTVDRMKPSSRIFPRSS